MKVRRRRRGGYLDERRRILFLRTHRGGSPTLLLLLQLLPPPRHSAPPRPVLSLFYTLWLSPSWSFHMARCMPLPLHGREESEDRARCGEVQVGEKGKSRARIVRTLVPGAGMAPGITILNCCLGWFSNAPGSVAASPSLASSSFFFFSYFSPHRRSHALLFVCLLPVSLAGKRASALLASPLARNDRPNAPELPTPCLAATVSGSPSATSDLFPFTIATSRPLISPSLLLPGGNSLFVFF